MSYDIIGDIHGHADALCALLRRMGYSESRGAWRHPSRTAIFVGDLIDRGPANIDAAMLARRMVEAGAARMVLGNHEFNALAFHTEDPARSGAWLRARTPKNLEQHKATLAEFEAYPQLARELLAWFHALPLFLDLPDIRVVHACWCRESVDFLRPRLSGDGSMPEALFIAACRKGSPEHVARDTLVNGPEISLPEGISFKDKDGHRRTDMRLQWWRCGAGRLPLKDAGLGLDDTQKAALPDDDLPADVHARYAPDRKPTFFGHYWLTDLPPALSSPKATCVDYSVARGGKLVAYRWDGEAELSAERFVLL